MHAQVMGGDESEFGRPASQPCRQYATWRAQLLHNFPPGATTSQGVPFWSPPKRLPKAVGARAALQLPGAIEMVIVRVSPPFAATPARPFAIRPVYAVAAGRAGCRPG